MDQQPRRSARLRGEDPDIAPPSAPTGPIPPNRPKRAALPASGRPSKRQCSAISILKPKRISAKAVNIGTAAKASSRQLGLKQVFPGQGDTSSRQDIDIVAIHGLDTQSPKTWVAWKRDGDPTSGEVHWLQDRDMLPAVIPNARISTYDWNANYAEEAATQGLLGHADKLLEKLHIQREKAGKNRPIVFVASCFGGLLLCRALHRASEGHNKYQHILKSTIAVAFLGTPFQGSHKGFFTATQLRHDIAMSMGGETADDLIKYLNNNHNESRQLDEVVQQFCEMANSHKFKFRIVCFYETHRTNFKKVLGRLSPEYRETLGKDAMGILVPQYSACLQGHERSELPVRHGLLNKFAGPDDPAFESISYYLKEFTKEALQMDPDSRIRNEHYNEDRLRIKRLSGESLPMNQCYINLALVEQPGQSIHRSKGEPEASPFSLSDRLKIETPEKELQVELSKLFNPRKMPDGQMKAPRRILIRGRAGVGKTTLCKKIVFDVTRNELWKTMFDRVLWVPLRNLKSTKPRNFEELFYHEYFIRLGNDRARELSNKLSDTLAISGDDTLFVLDGLDEIQNWGGHQDNNSHFIWELLRQSNVIITTRPHAALPLDFPKPDLELETIGFHPNQVQAYLKQVVRDPPKITEIQTFLQKHPLIYGLVRIPIQLDALCLIWDQGLGASPIPETMTAIYEAIIYRLWKKDLERLEKKPEDFVRSALPTEIDYNIDFEKKILECLAFSGLHSDVIEFQAAYREAVYKRLKPHNADFSLDERLGRLSFLRTSDPSADSSKRSYHFLHLTFQEFFAAQQFVRHWRAGEDIEYLDFSNSSSGDYNPSKVSPYNFLQRFKYTARYDIVWRFVAGLLAPKEVPRFLDAIEKEPLDLLGPTHQRLIMHCLGERDSSTNLPNRSRLEDRLSKWLLYECDLTGDSLLAREPECPDRVLCIALVNASSSYEKKIILETLLYRATQSSEAVLKRLVGLLQDEDLHVRSGTAEALGNQSQLPDMVSKGMGLLPESERLAMAIRSTHLKVRFVESFYGVWLRISFRQQLSLYVNDFSCIINQPSGLRTASLGNTYEPFCAMLNRGRQLWNSHGRKLWD